GPAPATVRPSIGRRNDGPRPASHSVGRAAESPRLPRAKAALRRSEPSEYGRRTSCWGPRSGYVADEGHLSPRGQRLAFSSDRRGEGRSTVFDFRHTNATRREFEELTLEHLDPLYSAALRLTKNERDAE